MEVANVLVEKSALVVKRKVSFPVVVKGHGNDWVAVEVNEPVGAMSHNEEQALVVYLVGEKTALECVTVATSLELLEM